MNVIYKLVSGEIKRLITYKILPISLLTSLIWIVIFAFLSKEDAIHIAPLLIFVDVSMMLTLLIGASSHLEKQEGTIKSMMVMPISLKDILIAKVVSSMVIGLESALVVSLSLLFIHGVTFNYALLLVFIIIAALAHAALGFFFALYSKDFTSMLGLLMAYMFPFTIPTILFSFGIINKSYEWVLMLSPSHSASYLISSSMTGVFDGVKTSIACVYLTLLALILFRSVVYPKFKDNAVRG